MKTKLSKTDKNEKKKGKIDGEKRKKKKQAFTF